MDVRALRRRLFSKGIAIQDFYRGTARILDNNDNCVQIGYIRKNSRNGLQSTSKKYTLSLYNVSTWCNSLEEVCQCILDVIEE